jgi:rubrerythrin
MASEVTLEKILTKAIEKEIHSQSLYRSLSQKVNDRAAKVAFRELAQDEIGHQKLLERYLRGDIKEGTLSHGQIVDYKLAEHLDQPALSVDMKLPEVFLLAANREMSSHEFYLGLAQIHPEGEVKRLFEVLAAEELKHKRKVELLYTEVAFPQTDGG